MRKGYLNSFSDGHIVCNSHAENHRIVNTTSENFMVNDLLFGPDVLNATTRTNSKSGNCGCGGEAAGMSQTQASLNDIQQYYSNMAQEMQAYSNGSNAQFKQYRE